MYKLINVSKNYGKKSVLTNISFEINQGDILSLIGKNGSGKTTLIKLLTGLTNLTSGEIYFLDKNIKKIGKNYYKQIGVVLEGDRNIYWYLTGMQNLLYFGRLYGIKDKDIISISEPYLELFDLKDDINRPVSNYSKGMKQKLAIIIGLLNKPQVLFLDEPTLGLDLLAKKELISQIKKLNSIDNITLIITSHEFDFIEQISNKLILINNRKIELIDNVPEFINNYFEKRYIMEVESNSKLFKLFNENIEYIEENGIIKIFIKYENFDNVLSVIKQLNDNNINIIKTYNETANLERIMANIWREL